MKRALVLAGCIALLSFALACQTQTATDTRAADESALRELDAQWSKAAGARDLDKSVSYYTDDAVVLPQNGPAANTKTAIRAIWKDMTSPGNATGWKANKVEVAKSGDMAYITGTYELTMNVAGGKPVNDRGKYVAVWKKQTDGTWKCVADTWNTDLPAAAPTEKTERREP